MMITMMMMMMAMVVPNLKKRAEKSDLRGLRLEDDAYAEVEM